MEESRSGTFATEEHMIKILENVPKANLSNKEIKSILSKMKKNENNMYHWRDLIIWAYAALVSIIENRFLPSQNERKKSELPINKIFDNSNFDKKYTNLTEISEKLLKLVKLKFDDKEKCLTLCLPGCH